MSYPAARIGPVDAEVPFPVRRLLTAEVAQEIARTFGDPPIYPQRIAVDSPGSGFAWVSASAASPRGRDEGLAWSEAISV